MRAIGGRVAPPTLSRAVRLPERRLQGEARPPLPAAIRRRWGMIAGISLGLHLALAAVILGGPAWLGGARPAEQPVFAQVELVDLGSPTVGDGPAAKAEAKDAPPTTAPPNTEPPAAADTRTMTPPAETAAEAAAPQPPSPVQTSAEAAPPPPAEAAAQPPRPASTPPATRLDASAELGRGLVKNAIPAALDSTVHNDPPAYPRLSARYHEQGMVMLNVLVEPDGSAREVQVSQSSGYDRLDHAALMAVKKWHFRPAEQDGLAVESVYPVNVQFELENK